MDCIFETPAMNPHIASSWMEALQMPRRSRMRSSRLSMEVDREGIGVRVDYSSGSASVVVGCLLRPCLGQRSSTHNSQLCFVLCGLLCSPAAFCSCYYSAAATLCVTVTANGNLPPPPIHHPPPTLLLQQVGQCASLGVRGGRNVWSPPYPA